MAERIVNCVIMRTEAPEKILKIIDDMEARGNVALTRLSGYVTKLMTSLPKAPKGAVPSVAELEKGLAED